MGLARNVGKVIGKGMKVSYQSVDNVLDKAYTKVGQASYVAGKKASHTASYMVGETMKGTGAVLKATGKGAQYPFKKADQLVDKGLDALEASGPKLLNSNVGQKLKLKERLNPIVDKKDKDGNIMKTWDNLYTGKKLNNLYGVAGAGAILGAAYVSSEVATSPYLRPLSIARKNVEQGGPPEIMMYDGVGQQQSAPRNLNANGDLVFGLHNQRRG